MGQQNQYMPNDNRNAETGRFASKHDRDEFLDALRALDGEAGTRAVADEADAPYSTTDHYLRKLEDDGDVRREDAVAGNANVWVVDDA